MKPTGRTLLQRLDPDRLPGDLTQCHALIRSLISDLDDCRNRIDYLARKLFGRQSERLEADEGQLRLFEDAAQAAEETDDGEAASGEQTTPRRAPVRHGRKPLPPNLPREVVEYDLSPEAKICDECGEAKQRIGVEITKQVDYQPASVKVIERHQLKYACPRCQGQVTLAEKPAQPIEKGLATAGLLAHIIVSKYCDHIPLNRMESILGRHGLDLSRSTLCDWTMQSAFLLEPVARAACRGIVQGAYVQTDDTGVPVLDPDNKGSTHQAYLWTYLGDQDHPYVAFDFTWTRSREGPEKFLESFKGFMQADAHPGYDRLYTERDIVEVGCWSHSRRRFFEAKDTDRLYAHQALLTIGELYAIEKLAKQAQPDTGLPMSADQRRALRREKSRPILDELFAWLKEIQSRVLPKSPMGAAIGYALKNETALGRYIDVGELEIDNNASERALRAVVIGRKNWMFAGSRRGGQAAAILYTLIASAKRNGLEPFVYLRDLLQRIPTHPHKDIALLLPDRWQPA